MENNVELKLRVSIRFHLVIETVTGLYIGGHGIAYEVGGIDNQVLKDTEGYPYIPATSLKGRMRSYTELIYGKVKSASEKSVPPCIAGEATGTIYDDKICLSFGTSDDKWRYGISRLRFSDFYISNEDKKKPMNEIFEFKTENFIDRLEGKATNVFSFERVNPGIKFVGYIDAIGMDISIDGKNISYKKELQEVLKVMLDGITGVKLLGLGGKTSRGYGRVNVYVTEIEVIPLTKNEIKEQYKRIKVGMKDAIEVLNNVIKAIETAGDKPISEVLEEAFKGGKNA